MSLESVRIFLQSAAPDLAILETDGSSATVALAAEAFGVEPDRIAKSLLVRVGTDVCMLVVSGTARLSNRKMKTGFGAKPRLLGGDDVLALTGHPVGGVCPFGLATPMRIFCDVSLKRHPEVLPAAGATNSAVRLSPDRLATITGATWVDVCECAPTDTDEAAGTLPRGEL